MKKLNVMVMIAALFAVNLMQAQEATEPKESKFSVLAFGGIGYGIMDNDNQPNYNMNSNTGDLLLNYKVHSKFGIATGVGINQLSGNGFNAVGNFYHERIMVRIPLLLTFDKPITDKFSIVGHLGPYAQTIFKDEYSFNTAKIEDVYDGWNFGFQLGLGFVYQIEPHFGVGINYTGQSDFTNLETRNNFVFSDEQKLKNVNTFGLILLFNL
ncbi:outer membrane beta-barrel protein [Bizionia psychrotolerans]|uniref:outer membrane beta-barrel protein n=1 Tax=Bizionia psychrotolerans TaxID=1492901 RepID=UPI000651CCBE|nr:outer membrane beta-barrel protein [Bizionia psychrotolerans]